jgi:hypothetical protein
MASFITGSCGEYATYTKGASAKSSLSELYASSYTRALSAIYPMAMYMYECDETRDNTSAEQAKALDKVRHFAKSALIHDEWVNDYFKDKFEELNAGAGLGDWETAMETNCNADTLASFFTFANQEMPIAFQTSTFEK